MQEPESILSNGTRVRTDRTLGSTVGMLVKQQYLDARRSNAEGTIKGWVTGHGGDVYWVQHDDGTVAAYGWMEFELVLKTRIQRVSDGADDG